MESVEQAVRESFGRLVAILATRSRDITAAEDALGDAVVAALERWPQSGVPANPEGWLVAVARRRLIDRARHSSADAARERALTVLSKVETEEMEDGAAFPDERLRLLFATAHPAIDPAMHAPLMLQAVLGLDAARIAAAFLIQPAAMSQRLVRAKAKIRDAGIPFAIPEERELPARLSSVTEAIYAAYGSGWDEIQGGEAEGSGALAEEAIWLGRVLVRLMPGGPEALGLLALMLHCEARRPARRTRDGRYVPLSEQEPRLWRRAMIDEAETVLAAAARFGKPGRFQIEAAIQSAHVGQRLTGAPGAAVIAHLHHHLFALAPRIGVAVARAVAVADAEGPASGLALLAALPAERVASYQPFHAAKSELLRRMGAHEAAHAAYSVAIDLARDAAMRRFLEERRRRLAS